MRRIKKLFVIASMCLAVLFTGVNLFISCVADADGSECDGCETNADCKDGMTCKIFTDFTWRCWKNSSTRCDSFFKNTNENIPVGVVDDSTTNSNNSSIIAPY